MTNPTNPVKLESSCNGRCCAVFTLSMPLADLTADPDAFADGPYMLDMLIPLNGVQAREREARFDVLESAPDTERFTCRHWDDGTRLCTAYESRPGMCRDYPQGACQHGCGCVREPDPDVAEDAVEDLMRVAGAIA